MRLLYQKGISLPELLISLVIGALILMEGSRFMTRFMGATKLRMVRADKAALMENISRSLDCEATLNPAALSEPPTNPPPGCSTVGYLVTNGGVYSVKLKGRRADGTVYDLMDANGVMGGWDIWASCTTKGLEVKAALPKTPTMPRTYEMDTVENIPRDLNHPSASIFQGGTALCASHFVPIAEPAGATRLEISTGYDIPNICPAFPPYTSTPDTYPTYDPTRRLCPQLFYKYVTFSKPFKTVPSITAVISEKNLPNNGPCTLGSIDNGYAYAGSVTTTGFYLYCGGSPPDLASTNAPCNAVGNWKPPFNDAYVNPWMARAWAFHRVGCSWIATGK